MSGGFLIAFNLCCLRQPTSRLWTGLPVIVFCFLACSCTLLAHSPQLAKAVSIPMLNPSDGFEITESGSVPYQRRRIPSWGEGMRYIWVVGPYDFRKADRVEIVFYFHGMHSKDYYPSFRSELAELAKKRPDRPFLFVGLVDTPFVKARSRSKHRWRFLVDREAERPDRLFSTVNHVYKGFKRRFPHIRKDKTRITLAGFSGGGRVLTSVGQWLAKSPKDDPYARVFLSRLSKIVYFDCWFDREVLTTVPTLLQSNPSIKIVGTVHMKKPKKHAAMLAGKLKLKVKKRGELSGVGGRLLIFRDKSHWEAMISRLRQALEA